MLLALLWGVLEDLVAVTLKREAHLSITSAQKIANINLQLVVVRTAAACMEAICSTEALLLQQQWRFVDSSGRSLYSMSVSHPRGFHTSSVVEQLVYMTPLASLPARRQRRRSHAILWTHTTYCENGHSPGYLYTS